jgi:hypothetical protein
MKKILLITLIALIVLVSLVLFLLPGIARRYAVNNSKELVGRQIDMDKLKLNYFTGMIRITDFIMYEENEQDEFVTFDTLIIRLKPFQLFTEQFILERFYLKGLFVNIIQQDSTFNFDDLVAFHMPPEDSLENSGEPVSDEPFQYHLSNLELKNANFIFDDRNIDKTTDILDLSFFVPYIGWNQEEKSEAGLRFNFKREGYFESSFNVDPHGGDFDAEITIYHLYLDAFKEYIQEYAKIDSIHGIFSSNVSIVGNTSEIENSVLSGRVELLDFEMTDQKKNKFLSAGRIDCLLKEVKNTGMYLTLDSLIFTEPYVYFEMDTVTNNFFEIFNVTPTEDSLVAGQTQQNTIDSSADSLFYAIHHVAIRNGSIDYRDKLTGEPFDYPLSAIELTTDSLLSTSDWIQTYATMLLNKRGKLNAEVGFNPANPYDINLEYVITDFQLSDLNIYSRHYMGFPILYGDMYYKSTTNILDGQLNSENKLIIEHAELGEKRGGLYDLPIKFALFLLKDRKGVIDLDVPVRGDLNDPTVSVGKIVWNTFKNLIVKVAAAPFDFLAGVIGADPKDLQSIEYEYGDTTLTSERQKQLDLLLELEQKKDGLSIELVYFNDETKEKEALAIEEVGNNFLKQTNLNYRENEEAFFDYVMAETKSDSMDLAEACLMLTNETRLDTLVDYYSQWRINQVTDYFSLKSDSTLIHVIVSNPEAPKNLGSRPMFEIKYSVLQPEASSGVTE